MPQTKEDRRREFSEKLTALDAESVGKFHDYDLSLRLGAGAAEVASSLDLKYTRTSAAESREYLNMLDATDTTQAALLVELAPEHEEYAERALQVLRRLTQDLLLVPRREPLPFLLESKVAHYTDPDGTKVVRGLLYFHKDLAQFLKKLSGGKLDLAEVIKELEISLSSPISSKQLRQAYDGLLATEEGFTDAGMEQLSEIYSKTQQLVAEGKASEEMEDVGEMSLTEWFEFAQEQCEGEDREGFESFILGAHEEVDTEFEKPEDLLVHQAFTGSVRFKGHVERTLLDAMDVLCPKAVRYAKHFEGGSCDFSFGNVENVMENFSASRKALFRAPFWDYIQRGGPKTPAGKRKASKRSQQCREAMRQPLKYVKTVRLVCKDFRIDVECKDLDAIRILQYLPTDNASVSS